jgi:hypothetical protein
MAGDWNYYLTAELSPAFVLGFIGLTALMCLVASVLLWVSDYRENHYRPKNVRSTYLPRKK